MEQQAILAALEAKLKKLGLGFESIKVFGVIRINVHVKCVSRDTADKWARVLSTVLGGGAQITCTKTMWEAVKNNGTSMRPTMRKGWLIGAVA